MRTIGSKVVQALMMVINYGFNSKMSFMKHHVSLPSILQPCFDIIAQCYNRDVDRKNKSVAGQRCSASPLPSSCPCILIRI